MANSKSLARAAGAGYLAQLGAGLWVGGVEGAPAAEARAGGHGQKKEERRQGDLVGGSRDLDKKKLQRYPLSRESLSTTKPS